MSLDSEAAAVITQAQNMLSGVKQMFPEVVAEEGPETLKMDLESSVAEVLWLLGSKVPRYARAGRITEARSKLVFAQGMFFGSGNISRHDLYLISDYPPASAPRMRSNLVADNDRPLIDARDRVYHAQHWLRQQWKKPDEFKYAEGEMIKAATLVDDRVAQRAFERACAEYVRIGVMWNGLSDYYLQPRDID